MWHLHKDGTVRLIMCTCIFYVYKYTLFCVVYTVYLYFFVYVCLFLFVLSVLL